MKSISLRRTTVNSASLSVRQILASTLLLTALAASAPQSLAQEGTTPAPVRPRRAYSTIDNYNYSHGGDVGVEQARKPKKKKPKKKTVVKTSEVSVTSTDPTSNNDRSAETSSSSKTSAKSKKTETSTRSENPMKSEKTETPSSRTSIKPVTKPSRDFADTIMTGKGARDESVNGTEPGDMSKGPRSVGTTSSDARSIETTSSTKRSSTESGYKSRPTASVKTDAATDSSTYDTKTVSKSGSARSTARDVVSPKGIPATPIEAGSDDLTPAKLSAIPKPLMPPPPNSIGGFTMKNGSATK